MAYGYRRKNPGSGGARPGAGRRPDISQNLRNYIGSLCQDQYMEAHYSHTLQIWLSQLIEAWETLNLSHDDAYYEYKTMASKLFEDEGESYLDSEIKTEPQILYGLIVRGPIFYSDLSRTQFDFVKYGYLIQAFAEVVLGPELSEIPEIRFPRHLIKRARDRIIANVQEKLLLGDSELVEFGFEKLDVSKGFIQGCWKFYQLK